MTSKENYSKQASERRTIQRRIYLRSVSAAGLLTMGMGTASAKSNIGQKATRKVRINIPNTSSDRGEKTAALSHVVENTPGLTNIDSNIPGIENISQIVVRTTENGGVSYTASGDSSVRENKLSGFSVNSGITADSDSLAVEVKAISDHQESNTDRNPRSGSNSGPKDTDNQKGFSQLSSYGNYFGDISFLSTDSGEDLLQNYEGGIAAQANTNEPYVPDDLAKHTQTYEWEANSSETDVISRSGKYGTDWITWDINQWNLEGNGWSETGFPGANAYGKSYSQLTKFEDVSTKRTQLQTDMTMKPDGTFEWWGKVENDDSSWGSSFELYPNYVDNITL